MSEPLLVDTHTHVNFNAFKDDGDEVVRRALAAGIWLINVGSQCDTSRRAVEYAERHREGVYAAVGLHPNHLVRAFIDVSELGEHAAFETRGETFDYEAYKTLAELQKVVAIGESGLDYYRLGQIVDAAGLSESELKAKQRENFLNHVRLASHLSKPLIIHCRNAHADLLEILKDFKTQATGSALRGVVHCFTGTWEEARQYLELGFFISFTGIITFARSYDEVVKQVPLERLLMETDAPYLAPLPHRGKRNEPGYVRFVAEKVAELKNLFFEDVARQTTENARGLFGF